MKRRVSQTTTDIEHTDFDWLRAYLERGSSMELTPDEGEEEGGEEAQFDDDGAKRRKTGWSETEDLVILACVRRIGTQWPRIAVSLPGRTADAVRNRWHRLQKTHALGDSEEGRSALDGLLLAAGVEPGWLPPQVLAAEAKMAEPAECIKGSDHGRAMWTAEEDALIEEGVRRFGCKWRQIAASLPGRSDSSVRNRWMRLQKERSEERSARDSERVSDRSERPLERLNSAAAAGAGGDGGDAALERLPSTLGGERLSTLSVGSIAGALDTEDELRMSTSSLTSDVAPPPFLKRRETGNVDLGSLVDAVRGAIGESCESLSVSDIGLSDTDLLELAGRFSMANVLPDADEAADAVVGSDERADDDSSSPYFHLRRGSSTDVPVAAADADAATSPLPSADPLSAKADNKPPRMLRMASGLLAGVAAASVAASALARRR